MKKTSIIIIAIITICLIFYGYILADKKKRLNRDFKLTGIDELEVISDIDGAEVKIRGGSADELKTLIYYEDDEYDADVYMDESKKQSFITLDKRGGLFQRYHYDSKYAPEVYIDLPTQIPILFKSEILGGDIEFDLRDVRFRKFELKSLGGEYNIDFSSPNTEIIERLLMNLKFGEINIDQLGNANFKYAKINSAAGELNVDLSGEYKHDDEVIIDLEFGETTVYLPRNVGVKLSVSKLWFLGHIGSMPYNLSKRGKYYYTSNYGRTEHELLVRVNAGVGEINIRME